MVVVVVVVVILHPHWVTKGTSQNNSSVCSGVYRQTGAEIFQLAMKSSGQLQQLQPVRACSRDEND